MVIFNEAVLKERELRKLRKFSQKNNKFCT